MKIFKIIKNLFLSSFLVLSMSGCKFIIENPFTSESSVESTQPSIEDIISESTSIDEITPSESESEQPEPTKEIVTIKSLSGHLNKPEERKLRQVRRSNDNSENVSEPEVSEEEVLEEKPQYVIMYKSESEIKFTITLNNPKGYAIDALELTCDDPDSQIMVDGAYKPIQYSDSLSRVVNWAQEDPYEKVYNIKTTSFESLQTLRVLDIKVNGVWQEEELSKNELKIYKMNDSDLVWNFDYNSYTEYGFHFTHSDAVSNIQITEGFVNFDSETLKGVVRGDSRVEYSYSYTYMGITLEWESYIDIELVKIEYSAFGLPLGNNIIHFTVVSGTDVSTDYIEYSLDGGLTYRKTGYKMEVSGGLNPTYGYYANGVFMDSMPEIYVKFGNCIYLASNNTGNVDFVQIVEK